MSKIFVAVLAFGFMSGVQAKTFTYDSEGMTISFSNIDDTWGATYGGIGELWANNFTKYSSGEMVDNAGGAHMLLGSAVFERPIGPIGSPYQGRVGTDSISTSFSFTASSKPGWQMAMFVLDGGVGGVQWVSNGALSSTYKLEITKSGGWQESSYYSGSGFQENYAAGGDWNTRFRTDISGNDLVSDIVFGPDHTSFTYKLSDNVDPFSSVHGTVSLTFSTNTSDPSQTAYLLGDIGVLVGARAVKIVSAVPEPDTYAMMAVALGVIGFAGRRRKITSQTT